MKRTASLWSSYFAGGFFGAVLFIALVLGIDSQAPSGASSTLVVLFAIGGAGCLVGWFWTSLHIFNKKRKTWLSGR